MASWKKHFRVVPNQGKVSSSQLTQSDGRGATSAKYSSYLPQTYAGHPNRIQRYYQYEDMDRDCDINAALDTIADFCTQSEEQSDIPFDIHYSGEPTETEVKIIKTYLEKWIKLQDFRSKLWFMFRNVIKHGDAFFLRDPETYEWLWLDHYAVELVKVDEEKGNKEPDEYVVRGIDYNKQAKFATVKADPSQYRTPLGVGVGISIAGRPMAGNFGMQDQFSLVGANRDPRALQVQTESQVIDAKHVVHLSLNVGMDINWPFGQSVLEPVFKVFKQKSLLEDAVLIYRIQRAPERRMFYIDCGTMPAPKANAYIEKIKNEIHQRRIPNRSGGGACLALNVVVPILDGRKLTIRELADEHSQGKQNWVYSCDPVSGTMIPGKITWAGVTRKDAQVIKLTLDNGESIICTPDHKFPILGRGKTEAKDIVPNVDSLISFNTRLHSINKRVNMRDPAETNDPLYHQVYDHSDNTWKFTHRTVANFFKSINKHNVLIFDNTLENQRLTVIHHKDFNKYNNSPENLAFMDGYDHFQLHTQQGWHALNEQNRQSASNKLSESLRKMRKRIKEEEPEKYKTWMLNQGKAMREAINSNPAHKARLLKNCAVQMQKPWPNQKNEWTDKLFYILLETFKTTIAKEDTAKALSNNEEFMRLYREVNAPRDGLTTKLVYEYFSESSLEKLVVHFGYKGWLDFIRKNGKQKRLPTRALRWNEKILAMLVDAVKTKTTSRKKVADLLSNDEKFMEAYKELNGTTMGNGHRDKVSKQTLLTCVKSFGYEHWTDFVQKAPQYNHKVISIEWLEDRMDVGTITIDGQEEYHNHHTFSIAQGVYTYNSVLDAAYNPLSMLEDYFFATSSEGKGSRVEVLPGGELVGEIGDLVLFSKKLARGLRIPTSYLGIGDDEGQGMAWNDGKLGAAAIQEFRFNKYCMRLQSLLAPTFDKEFKKFLEENGVEIESNLFEIRFNAPQNFTRYREIELDQAQLGVFGQISENKHFSERFKQKKWLKLTDDEILENETMWAEENADKIKAKSGETPAESNIEGDLSSVGIRPPDMGLPGELGPEEGEEGETGAAGGPATGAGGIAGGPAGETPPPTAPAGGPL